MGNSMRKKVFRRKDIKVLFVGLDSSGKTTLVYSFKGGRIPQIVPTVGFNAETVKHRHVKVTCWDIGYQDRTRDSIKHYLPGTECIVFVVDSSDKSRLSEAIDSVLVPICQHPEVDGVPVLILANKQDLDGAMSPEQIQFAVFNTKCIATHPWTVIGVSASKGHGKKESLDWMVSSVCKYGRSRSLFRSRHGSNCNTMTRNTIHTTTQNTLSKDPSDVSLSLRRAKSTMISTLPFSPRDS